MIIVQQKHLDKILEMTKDYKRLLIIGCDGCASVVKVGGERQAKVLKSLLELRRKTKGDGPAAVEAISILRQCDKEVSADALKSSIANYDGIVCLGCGVGVQTLAEICEPTPVVPGTDTKFLGMHDTKEDKFYEMCKACGDCLLFETGGICPITRCAKSLLNGPCGGQAKGKCEVGGWTNDCAWILIYNRLKERGRLDLFTKFRAPRDFRVSEHPRETSIDVDEEKGKDSNDQ